MLGSAAEKRFECTEKQKCHKGRTKGRKDMQDLVKLTFAGIIWKQRKVKGGGSNHAQSEPIQHSHRDVEAD